MTRVQAVPYDAKQTALFLNSLFHQRISPLFVEFRALRRDGSDQSVQQRWVQSGPEYDGRVIRRLIDGGWDVYVGPGLRVRRRGTRADVARVVGLWVDMDAVSPVHPNAPYASKRAAFLAFAERLPRNLFPSAIVDTGYGLQGHWFLTAGIVADDGNVGRIEGALRRIARVLDGDPVTDVSRIVRLAGTANMKDPTNPRPVRLIHLARGRRFTLEAFDAISDVADAGSSPEDEETSQEWVATLLMGVAQGERHDAAKRLAGHFIGKGESKDNTREILRAWALRCTPPWIEPGADKELRDIITWALAQEATKASIPPAPDADPATIQAYVDRVRTAPKMAGFLKKRAVAAIVTDRLRAGGRFLATSEGPMYFRRERGRVIELVAGGSGLSGLLEPFGLNPTESEYHFSVEHLRTEALERGEPCEVSRLAHYDTTARVLYLSQFDGRVLQLDGQTITPFENGQGGVYFKDDPAWLPWEAVPGAQPGAVREELVDRLHFEGSHIAADDARYLWWLWILALFFGEWMKSKPLCLLTGPKGAGKTSAFRALLVALLGPRADVLALEGGQRGEEAFLAAITAGRIVAFDNADAKITWLEDHLARVATGSDIVRRELYTTNSQIKYRPLVFVGLTARTPKFRREDVAERMLVLPMAELEQKEPERALIERVLARRPAIWAELVHELNRIVGRLKATYPPLRTSIRMADFVEFARRAVRDRQHGQLAWRALQRMEFQQADYALTEDPLFAALEEWVTANPTRGFVDATTLNGDLRTLAQQRDEDWPYKNGQHLGTRLRDVQGALSKFLRVERRKDKGKKRTEWAFSALRPTGEFPG
jgi:hypothetical protein